MTSGVLPRVMIRPWSGPAVGAGLVVLVLLLLIGGQGSALRFGFPLLALGTAGWLYLRRGFAAWLGFAWWIWFLAPGLRRIVDYQTGGWEATNPISLAPYLVAGIAVVPVVHRLPALSRKRLLPWLVLIGCIGAGYFVGVLRNGIASASHSLLAWLVPVMLGLAIAVQWEHYPSVARVLGRTFLAGLIVLAGYAVFQFTNPPPWDRLWVEGAGFLSAGVALPLQLRAFSFLNSPMPLALVLLAGIMVTLARPFRGKSAVLALGVVGLTLTLVRSVWIAALAGLVVLLAGLPARAARRTALAGALAIGLLAAIPALLSREVGDPILRAIGRRVETLTRLREDLSLEERLSFSQQMSAIVVSRPVGEGLGSTGVSTALGGSDRGIRDFDNGFLAVFYVLGWFGGGAALLAALAIAVTGMTRREPRGDLMPQAARAVVVAGLLLLVSANVMEGVLAAVIWSFAGLLAASRQWYSVLARQSGQPW